ncbi:MAG: hypothetical protein ACT4PY_15690 [Armatimonadota bacterium]
MQRPAGVSTRAPVRLREGTEADEPGIVEIGNALFPDFLETLEEFRRGRAAMPAVLRTSSPLRKLLRGTSPGTHTSIT